MAFWVTITLLYVSCTANSCECNAAVRALVDCIHLSIASDLVEIRSHVFCNLLW